LPGGEDAVLGLRKRPSHVGRLPVSHPRSSNPNCIRFPACQPGNLMQFEVWGQGAPRTGNHAVLQRTCGAQGAAAM
jgi:hypothetical protein